MRGKIGDDRPRRNRASAVPLGARGWGPLVEQGRLRDGRFDDRLVAASVELIAEQWRPEPAPTWVAWVPSRRRPGPVADLARRIAAGLDLPPTRS